MRIEHSDPETFVRDVDLSIERGYVLGWCYTEYRQVKGRFGLRWWVKYFVAELSSDTRLNFVWGPVREQAIGISEEVPNAKTN